MGCVYEAKHTGTGRRVAVKLIDLTGRSSNQTAITRFHREARAAGAIDTQHITQVLDVGTDPTSGVPYIVMEFLLGMDLRQLLDRFGPLEPNLALRIAAQACIGLHKAHDAQVIHRDIKPANIFLAKRDLGEHVVKLLDFGIAKFNVDPMGMGEAESHLTKTGSLLGTPQYMSPEQLRELMIVDHRTDIWSLGVVLYQLLTGRTPYQDIDAFGELIIAICCDRPQTVQECAPWIRAEVAEIVHRAICRSPNERFESAIAMFEAICALLPDGWTITDSLVKPLSESAKKPVTDPFVNSFHSTPDVQQSVGQSSAGVSLPTRPPTREELTSTSMHTQDNARSVSKAQIRAGFEAKSAEGDPKPPMFNLEPTTTSSSMGRIERVGSGETFLLRSQLLLGRSESCDLRINEPRVSSEHARVRWTGTTWEVRDLGSKNGTFVGERRLSTGDRATLLMGDTLGLGGAKSPAPVFLLVDGSAPVASARSKRTGAVRFANSGLIALPDDAHPDVSVVEGREGKWFIETNETVLDVSENEIITIHDEAWILDVANVATSTLIVEGAMLMLESITLRFVVSLDEKECALTVVCPGKEIRVPPEKHHSLLLTLARERLRSVAEPLTERGWLDRTEICRMLAIDEQRLNVEVLGARKQFAVLGIQGAANVIERRPGTRELRLGVERVEVTRGSF